MQVTEYSTQQTVSRLTPRKGTETLVVNVPHYFEGRLVSRLTPRKGTETQLIKVDASGKKREFHA